MVIWCRIRRECLVDRRDFPEDCCRPKPHHLCVLGVQLKALWRAPVVHRHHTSSKPSSDVTNVGRLAVLDALHVVSKQMVLDTMLLKNVGDILCVGDEGPTSKHGPLRFYYPQFTDKWWVCPDYNNLCPINVVGGEPVERSITDIAALLKHIQHNTIINSIECCWHVQLHKSSDVTSVDGCHHVVVQVNKCCLGWVLSAVGELVNW